MMVNTRPSQAVVADGPAANVTTTLGPNNSDGHTSGITHLGTPLSTPTIATTPTIRRDWHSRKLAIRASTRVQRRCTEASSFPSVMEGLRGTFLASVLPDTS